MFRTLINKFKTKTQPNLKNETPHTTAIANVNAICNSDEGKKCNRNDNATATPSQLPGVTNWILTGGKVAHTATEFASDLHWDTFPTPGATDKCVLSNEPNHGKLLSSRIETTKRNSIQILGDPYFNDSTNVSDLVVRKVATCPNFQSLTQLKAAKLCQTIPFTDNAQVNAEKRKQKTARSVSLDLKTKTRCTVFVKFKEKTQVLSMTSFIDKFYVKSSRNANEEPKVKKESESANALETKLTAQKTGSLLHNGGEVTNVRRHYSQDRFKTLKKNELKRKKQRHESRQANKSNFYNVDLCLGEITFNLLPGSNLESDILPPEMLSSTSSRHRFLRVTDKATGEQFQLRVPDEPAGKEQHSLRTKSSLLYFLTEALDQTGCDSKIFSKIPSDEGSGTIVKSSKVTDLPSPINGDNNDTEVNVTEEIKDGAQFKYEYFINLEALESRQCINYTQIHQDTFKSIISETEYTSDSFEKPLIIERKSKIRSNDKKCTMSSAAKSEKSNTLVVLSNSTSDNRLIHLHCNTNLKKCDNVEVDSKSCINTNQRKNGKVPMAKRENRKVKKGVRKNQANIIDNLMERATLNYTCNLESGRNQAVLFDDVIERASLNNKPKLSPGINHVVPVDEIIERPTLNSERKLKSGRNQLSLADEVIEGPTLNNRCRRKSWKNTFSELHSPGEATTRSEMMSSSTTLAETKVRSVSSIRIGIRDKELYLEEFRSPLITPLMTKLSDIEEVLETSNTEVVKKGFGNEMGIKRNDSPNNKYFLINLHRPTNANISADKFKRSIYKSISNDDYDKFCIVNSDDITLLHQNDVPTDTIENISSQCTHIKRNNEELVASLCKPINYDTSGSHSTVDANKGKENFNNMGEDGSEILISDNETDSEGLVENKDATFRGKKVLKYYKQRKKSPSAKRYRPFGMSEDGHEGFLGIGVCSQNQGIGICDIDIENTNQIMQNAHKNKNNTFNNKWKKNVEVAEESSCQDIRESHLPTEFRNTKTLKTFRQSKMRTAADENTDLNESHHSQKRYLAEHSVDLLNDDDKSVALDFIKHFSDGGAPRDTSSVQMSKKLCALQSDLATYPTAEIKNEILSAGSNTSIKKTELQDDSKTSLSKSGYTCNISKSNEADEPFVQLKFKVLGNENSFVSLNIACLPSSKKSKGKTLKYYKNKRVSSRKLTATENTVPISSQHNMRVDNEKFDVENNTDFCNQTKTFKIMRKSRYIAKTAKKYNSNTKKQRFIKEKLDVVESILIQSCCTTNVESRVVSEINQVSFKESWLSLKGSHTSIEHASEELFQSCPETLLCPNLTVSSEIFYLKKNTDALGYLADSCASTNAFASSFSVPQIECSIPSDNCGQKLSLLTRNISDNFTNDKDYLPTLSAEYFIPSDNTRVSSALLDQTVTKNIPKNEIYLPQDEYLMSSENKGEKLALLPRDRTKTITNNEDVNLPNATVVESSNSGCKAQDRVPSAHDFLNSNETSTLKLSSQSLQKVSDKNSKTLSSSQGSNLQSAPYSNFRSVGEEKSQSVPNSNRIRAKKLVKLKTKRKRKLFQAQELIREKDNEKLDFASQDDEREERSKDEERPALLEVHPQIKHSSSDTTNKHVDKVSSEMKKSYYEDTLQKSDDGLKTTFDFSKSRKFQNNTIEVEDLKTLIRKYETTKARFVIKCKGKKHGSNNLDTTVGYQNLSLEKSDPSANQFAEQHCVQNLPCVKSADFNNLEYDTSLHHKGNKKLIQLLERLFGILDNSAEKKLEGVNFSRPNEETQEKPNIRNAGKRLTVKCKKSFRKKESKGNIMEEITGRASKEKETRNFPKIAETDKSELKQTYLSISDEPNGAFITQSDANNLQIENAKENGTSLCSTTGEPNEISTALVSSVNQSQHSVTEIVQKLDSRKVGNMERKSEDKETNDLTIGTKNMSPTNDKYIVTQLSKFDKYINLDSEDELGINVPKYKIVKMQKEMDSNALTDTSVKIIPNIADKYENASNLCSKNVYQSDIVGIKSHLMMSTPNIQKHEIGHIFVKLPKLLNSVVTAISSSDDTLEITHATLANKYTKPIHKCISNNDVTNVQEGVQRSQVIPYDSMKSYPQHTLSRTLDSRKPNNVSVDTTLAKTGERKVENCHLITETDPTVDDKNARHILKEPCSSNYSTYNKKDMDETENTDKVVERYCYEEPGLQVNYVRIRDRPNNKKERHCDHGPTIQEVDGDSEFTQTERVEKLRAREKHRREVMVLNDDKKKLKENAEQSINQEEQNVRGMKNISINDGREVLLLNEHGEEREEKDGVAEDGEDVSESSEAPKEGGRFSGFMKNKILPLLRVVTVGPTTLDEHLVKTYRLLRGDAQCDINCRSDADD